MHHDQPSAPQRRVWWLRPSWFAYLGLIGLLGTLHPSLAPLRVLVFCSLIYLGLLIIGGVRTLLRPQVQASEVQPDLPLPGPALQHGKGWFLRRLNFSLLLTHVNPFQLIQLVCHIGGQIIATRRSARSTTPAKPEPPVIYTLPVEGTWLVYNGGDTPETSHSWDLLNQRYAYDFVVADAYGQRHPPGAGEQISDYFAYGQPVVAPADGVVVQVRDGVCDAPAPGTGWLDWLSPDFRGNFVVIRHAPNAFSFLAHLIPGSLKVQVGQTVQRGELIGRCGNSGHSTEPHLHFHVQDHANFYLGIGLPVQFADVVVEAAPSQTVILKRGMRVHSMTTHPFLLDRAYQSR